MDVNEQALAEYKAVEAMSLTKKNEYCKNKTEHIAAQTEFEEMSARLSIAQMQQMQSMNYMIAHEQNQRALAGEAKKAKEANTSTNEPTESKVVQMSNREFVSGIDPVGA